MEHNVLEVTNLYKQFGSFIAVDHISFSIGKGEVVGLLGPNGAGKTTTIQMLMGITEQSSGSIKYFGKSFREHRGECLQRVNFTSAYNSLQGRTTALENLLVFAGLYKVSDARNKINVLSDKLDITAFFDKQYKSLSSGQKTRVNLVKSLLNDPELILMDEPTASLDPDIADRFMSIIEEFRKEKKLAILYTSHDMDEVTRICDRVIFLDHGKIVAEDTPLGLTKRITASNLQITFDGDRNPIQTYLSEMKLSHEFNRRQVVTISLEEKMVPKVIFGLSKVGVWMTDIEIKKPDLEDVFLDIARGGKHVVDSD